MEDFPYIAVPEQLATIKKQTTELQFSMGSEPLVGALLRTLVASKPAGHFLEMGTGTGIATAWLLAGMDSKSRLISVDADATVQEVAHNALGHDPRSTLITSDGTEYLKAQASSSFDLMFADAMLGKYESLEMALSVVKPGGFYVIDDMLPQANWQEGHAAKIPILLERLAHHPEFELAPLVWAIAVKKAAPSKS